MKRADSSATALRIALTSPWPLLRESAKSVINDALQVSSNQSQAADLLGISVRSLRRLVAQLRENTGV